MLFDSISKRFKRALRSARVIFKSYCGVEFTQSVLFLIKRYQLIEALSAAVLPLIPRSPNEKYISVVLAYDRFRTTIQARFTRQAPRE